MCSYALQQVLIAPAKFVHWICTVQNEGCLLALLGCLQQLVLYVDDCVAYRQHALMVQAAWLAFASAYARYVPRNSDLRWLALARNLSLLDALLRIPIELVVLLQSFLHLLCSKRVWPLSSR